MLIYFGNRRLDAAPTSLADSKLAESSMKHLIAAAQAKIKPSHTQSLLPDYVISEAVRTPLVHARSSPSPASPFHMLTPENSVNTGAQDCNMSKPLLLPSKPSHQISYKNQGEIEKCAHSRPGKTPRERSLSGSIEVAVARETLEGMIETLSRNKESIGRATRLAINCAKYGIASEVSQYHELLFFSLSIILSSLSVVGCHSASYLIDTNWFFLLLFLLLLLFSLWYQILLSLLMMVHSDWLVFFNLFD